MSRKSRTTVGAVEKLIEQRRLFQDWLVKLDGGGEGMPPHVIDRVRNDYRARLTAVTTELSEHSESLRDALTEAQERHEGLEKQQTARKDELAELRLRKLVGELDEGKFRDENATLGSALESLKKELGAALRDIERYEEILDVIAESAKPEPEPEEEEEEEPEPPKAAAPEPKSEPKAETPVPDKAPERVDRPSGEVPKPRPTAEDELAFLRSVTTTVSAVKMPPPAPKPRSDKPAEKPKAETAPAVTIDAAPGLIVLPKAEEQAAAPAARGKPQAETAGVKCAECGTQNRPTEWYCEKCGAELSAF